jgi:hypothetical protein
MQYGGVVLIIIQIGDNDSSTALTDVVDIVWNCQWWDNNYPMRKHMPEHNTVHLSMSLVQHNQLMRIKLSKTHLLGKRL